ncbi:MAG: hypothetical protein M3044_00395 [Thermoproteota archaeon]|nr:hypothetical protein [Thermoproteota archaeon]
MKGSNIRTLQVAVTIGTLLFAFAFNIQTTFQFVWGQTTGGNTSLGVYTSDSKPYGLSYEEWTAKWWTWLMSIPTNVNPAGDSSGANCAQNQAGPVWFLAGSTTGKAERSCAIPSGKAILFPIQDAECSYAEYPKLKTESDLRNCAVSQQNGVTHIEATVDGVSLQKLQMQTIQSPLFSFTFPENNLFGASAGPSQSVADGNYVFLHPLTPGKHDIGFKAVSVQFTTTGVENVAQNIVYHLIVQ